MSGFTTNSKNFTKEANGLVEFCSEIQLTFLSKIKLRKPETPSAQKCSNLTSIDISRSNAQKLNLQAKSDKVFVKFKLAPSPLVKYKNKDVTKRVLALVESSYTDEHLAQSNNIDHYYAILNITDDTSAEDPTSYTVTISEFLFKQLALMVYSKIQITTISKDEIEDKMTKSFVLKTSILDVSGTEC